MPQNLLIVEDNMIIAMDLKERLEQFGYQVCAIAQTGESAVVMASRAHPDLILMDIGLGKGIDGIEAAQLIRNRQPTPVIFVTGNSHLLDDKELYLDKPFDEQELLSIIKKLIGCPE